MRVTIVRHGENVVDASGMLIKNVGGDFLQGHRPVDPTDRTFLDGILKKTRRFQFLATYEFINQGWVDGWYEYQSISNESTGATDKNSTFGVRLRMEL
jgi:hypothetical protein